MSALEAMQKAFELCSIKWARKPLQGVDEGSDMYVFFWKLSLAVVGKFIEGE